MGHASAATVPPRAARADSAEAEDDDILLSSSLHNPSDALKLLAFASAQRARNANGGITPPALSETKAAASVSNDECWRAWGPVEHGVLDQNEAEALFLFFQLEMAPLYPLLTPTIFLPHHLPILTSTESLLLLSIVSISARYSPLLTNAEGRGGEIHLKLAERIRAALGRIMDGDANLRHISSVEALLLLSEWPLLPKPEETGRAGRKETEGSSTSESGESEEGRGEGSLVQVSNRYDSVSWGYIGWAVRLAQELGIHNQATYPGQIDPGQKLPHPWDPERSMRTFIYCYNADRQSARRDSVVQAFLSSQWWEEVMRRAPGSSRDTADDVWVQYAVSQGMTAALMGTIQDRLFSNVEITRAMLKTGQWESFLRSLEAELATMRRNAHAILSEENLSSTLVKIELDYVLLYGNAVTLRALQERLKRRMKAKDSHFKAPSILNLQEGRFILDALAAAQSILHLTVSVLEPKGFLRLCPARIFQRILFSAVFLFKSLAVGVVEHGQTTLLDLLERTISALYRTSIDENHLSRGFAALLSHLQAQCKPRLLTTADTTFPWDWDPTSEFIAVGREQDLLFNSLWNDGGLGGGSDFNIMGTLLGDNFGSGEFGGEF
ncbi:hypothetical protein RQP46_009633 [Phenoliferia psychrophenolica]